MFCENAREALIFDLLLVRSRALSFSRKTETEMPSRMTSEFNGIMQARGACGQVAFDFHAGKVRLTPTAE